MQQRPASKRTVSAIRLGFSDCFPLQQNEGKSAVDFYSTLALSSSPVPRISSRHSVTSRIEHNCLLFSHLIFSSRQLNATPVITPTC
jgi:hypothetical protein